MLDIIRAAIASGIAAKVPALRGVGVHGGVFGATDLQRYATQAPYAVVVAEGSRQSELQSTTLTILVDFTCFLIVRGTSAEKRDEASLALTYAVAKAIHLNRWSSALLTAPRNIEWRNGYTPEIDKLGISIQAITWEQGVQITNEIDLATLDDFETFATTYKLDDSIATYEQEGIVTLPTT
jgi:hypothetical protein